MHSTGIDSIYVKNKALPQHKVGDVTPLFVTVDEKAIPCLRLLDLKAF